MKAPAFFLINFLLFANAGNSQDQNNYQWPSISADGSKLLYSKYGKSFGDICLEVLDLETQKVSKLLCDPVLEPEWSPDGSQILFVDTLNNFFVYDVKSKTRKQILSSEKMQGIQTPSWSFDGSKIYFGAGKFPMISIHCLDLAAGKSTPITTDSSFNYGPAIAKNGKSLVYRHVDLKNKTNRGIWQLDLTTRSEKRLTEIGEYPTWSADGEFVYFQGKSRPDQKAGIYRVKRDGTQLTRLTSEDTISEWPVASRDGKIIYFTAKDTNDLWKIYSMNPDGSNLKAVSIPGY